MNCGRHFFTLFVFFGLCTSFCNAQISIEDSLAIELQQANSDTTKINLLLKFAEKQEEDSLIVKYSNQAISILESKIDSSQPALRKYFAITMGNCLQQIGSTLIRNGQYDKAISKLHSALKWHKKFNNKHGIAQTKNSIGFVHLNLGQFEEAIGFFNESYKLFEECRDTFLMAQVLGNAAVTYDFLKQPDKQKQKLKQALTLASSSGNNLAAGTAMHNLAVFFYHNRQTDSSIYYMRKSLAITKKSNSLYDISFSYLGASGFYRIIGENDSALAYAKKAYETGKQINSIDILKRSALELYTVHLIDSNYKDALTWYEEYIEQKDSLLKEESQAQALKKQFVYEKEKQAAITKTEKEKQNLIIVSVSAGLLMVLVFAAFLWNRFRVTNKQKQLIELQQKETQLQKEIVEEKNKEITDSINYAKRLQAAIMPSISSFHKTFSNSFILYIPKDIVAGDFYWMKELNKNEVLIAAADCTGHGIPGALVSVVCLNALNRAVLEFGLTKPGEILDQTKKLVIETFKASGENVKDGMDVALCKIERKNSSVLVQYAGANNPLWIIRSRENMQPGSRSVPSTDEKFFLHEIKGDKQPIGIYETNTPFTTHEIELTTNESLYLFSDGFADQFGGEKGKKFKYRPFKQLLLDHHNKSGKEQQELYEKAFAKWKGNHEQVDDVCLVGIKV